ncbi:MAG TPA: L-rhamnose isomerase [Solirubrobacteraceae bacterium]|nr:L-rhamnose isomerase [Solirubrobacteraceae bacterium]
MTDTQSGYQPLARRLTDGGHDLPAIERALAAFAVETPSWGYGDSGTRFGVFPQPGRPRDVFEKIADAAEVHRLTGSAPAVAMHFPWDAVDNLNELSEQLAESGLRAGAVNPNLFQDPDYKLGSITNPDAGIRRKAVEHLLECVQIAAELGSTAQSLWLADGTNYAGQDDLGARRDRLQEGLAAYYAALPSEQELLVEYKFFEPAFYATDIGDWGSALLLCQALGERARVLVDLGHHAQGVNVEQIVAILAREDRLGGFHFNNRKYADDDLIVGSVNPMELFLIFAELGSGGQERAGGARLTIDQSHNIEAKLEAMVLSVVNLQESYAKSLLIDRPGLAQAQGDGDVLRGHELMLDAFNTDVRPLCAKVREERGAAADPIGELRASGYAERMARERGAESAPRQRATASAGLGVTE